ncbi:PstS family phosphate ABC transporter substrate-binding protein [Isosphaeraceae bacterium EP7]
MNRPNVSRSITLAILCLVVPVGCGGGDETAPSAGREVRVDGSSTVFRISKAAQERFSEVRPEIQVVVDKHGTGGGFKRYMEGEVDVIDASRPARADEAAEAKAKGLDWIECLVGYDGITVAVNEKNDFAKSITVAQLKALWEPESKLTTWKDLDPSWPDRKISLYSPDSASGTFEFFTEAVVGKAKSQRKDVQVNADDNQLVSGVAGDVDAIGYFGYAYYASNAGKLNALSVADGSKPAVGPSPETILDKTYSPLSRPLYIYVHAAALKRPEVAEFVKFYLDHVGEVSKAAQYVPPTAADVEANAKALGQAAATSPAAAG